MKTPSQQYDMDCRQCRRLSEFLDKVKKENPSYHARPVAPFGVQSPPLLIVGLAPGMHGANATGRPFTGDFAGLLLYETLYRFGFSNQPQSVSRQDKLQLVQCRITNAVKCLPPQNKPTGAEIANCNRFLKAELQTLKSGSVVIALGSIAHGAVLRAMNLKQKAFKFGHCVVHRLNDDLNLIDSYHCSRYNTQTQRLTPEMFYDVFKKARKLIVGKNG